MSHRSLPAPSCVSRTPSSDLTCEGAVRVVVVIPAHNEEDQIAETLERVLAQTLVATRIVVVADNCSDATADVARSKGVEVFATRGNTAKKAGALNQAWEWLLPTLADTDKLLVLDADTHLPPQFLGNALAHFTRRSDLAALCGASFGRTSASTRPGKLLSLLQQMEYEKFRRKVARKKGVTPCLIGRATLFSVAYLRQLTDERGYLYDPTSIVEDYELTLAMRRRGWAHLSPKDCPISTEVMPTLRKLWHQRVRWARGTLDELGKYGWSRVTLVDQLWQLALGGMVLFRLLVISAVTATLILFGSLDVSPFWALLNLLFVADHVWSVRETGKAAMAVAALLVVEIAYEIFCEAYFVWSACLHLRRKQAVWHPT